MNGPPQHDYEQWSPADWDSWYLHAARLEDEGLWPEAAAAKAFALVADERKARPPTA